jgi:hypothetical protein
MKIRLQDGLPVAAVTLIHGNQQLTLENVVIDTGSAGTIFPIETVETIGLGMEPDDMIIPVRGVGGSEFVFVKQVDHLALDNLAVERFAIDVGAMDYGFDIDGILGIDFLIQARAVIDLANLEIGPAVDDASHG